VRTGSNIQKAAFEKRIAELQEQLGIPEDYQAQHKLRPREECTQLISIGQDIFGRDQQMAPRAAQAWFDMKEAAASSGIELQAVSAFRSIDYQAGIIRRKLDAGLSMENILEVSAAPGFSEHHTGRALDITTPGFEPLEEVFEDSPAFKWLQKSAVKFGFKMSFPRNNPHGVAYEPWHWCWDQHVSRSITV
jgi:D-alanyl-D-alanine carboxypeptidase